MTKREKIKLLISQNRIQEERIALLENIIKDFHKKMNGLLTFCKLQDKQTDYEIIESSFNRSNKKEV